MDQLPAAPLTPSNKISHSPINSVLLESSIHSVASIQAGLMSNEQQEELGGGVLLARQRTLVNMNQEETKQEQQQQQQQREQQSPYQQQGKQYQQSPKPRKLSTSKPQTVNVYEESDGEPTKFTAMKRSELEQLAVKLEKRNETLEDDIEHMKNASITLAAKSWSTRFTQLQDSLTAVINKGREDRASLEERINTLQMDKTALLMELEEREVTYTREKEMTDESHRRRYEEQLSNIRHQFEQTVSEYEKLIVEKDQQITELATTMSSKQTLNHNKSTSNNMQMVMMQKLQILLQKAHDAGEAGRVERALQEERVKIGEMKLVDVVRAYQEQIAQLEQEILRLRKT